MEAKMTLDGFPPNANDTDNCRHQDECEHDAERAEKAVEKAVAEVKAATKALQHAEHDLERAEALLDKAKQQNCLFNICIIYNGLEKKIAVTNQELIKTILEQAIREFGNLPNPHTLALFNTKNEELNDTQTAKEAGVKARDKLLLRPSAVRGGSPQ